KPTHTFNGHGVFTVTLTVSDGFGGTDTDTAIYTVENAPPQFIPASFDVPQAVHTPSGAERLGSVVAVVGDLLAVGAPNDNTSGNQSGAVYLYSILPGSDVPEHGADDSDFGMLVKVLANPMPATDDHFGASVAVVGNLLIVGAPGDDSAGTDNGIVYLFDAAPASPSFGQILAT